MHSIFSSFQLQRVSHASSQLALNQELICVAWEEKLINELWPIKWAGPTRCHSPNPTDTALQMWFNSYLTRYWWDFVSEIWYTKMGTSFSVFSLVCRLLPYECMICDSFWNAEFILKRFESTMLLKETVQALWWFFFFFEDLFGTKTCYFLNICIV